jgi:hypothetical protein
LVENSVIYIRSRSISSAANLEDLTYLSSSKMKEISMGADGIYDNGGCSIFGVFTRIVTFRKG